MPILVREEPMPKDWLWGGCGFAALLLFVLSGCAASTPTLIPAEYPFHGGQEPQLALHWRLTVDSNRVQADGLMERQRESHVRDVWLQLLGIDAAGRIVSHTAPVRFLWRTAGAFEPFTLVLTPRGGEQRYEVRVHTFEFEPQLQQRT
jgi:hypothetical protein